MCVSDMGWGHTSLSDANMVNGSQTGGAGGRGGRAVLTGEPDISKEDGTRQ